MNNKLIEQEEPLARVERLAQYARESKERSATAIRARDLAIVEAVDEHGLSLGQVARAANLGKPNISRIVGDAPVTGVV